MAHLGQDLSSYTAQDFSPIPPGEYFFEVTDSAVVDTKKGGRMIKVTCKVLGPTHVGRVVFENFVLGQDVAMARLKSLATFGGHPRPDFIQDTEELHGLRFLGSVGIREQEGYQPSNHIKTFKKIPAPQPAPMPQAQPQYPQPQPQPMPMPPAGQSAPFAQPFAQAPAQGHSFANAGAGMPQLGTAGAGIAAQNIPAAYPPPPPPMQPQLPAAQSQYQPAPMPQAQAPKPAAPWVK